VCEGLILDIKRANFPNGYQCTTKTTLQHLKHFHSILMLQKLVSSHLWHDLWLKADSIIWHFIKINIWWLRIQVGDISFDLVINKLFGLVIV